MNSGSRKSMVKLLSAGSCARSGLRSSPCWLDPDWEAHAHKRCCRQWPLWILRSNDVGSRQTALEPQMVTGPDPSPTVMADYADPRGSRQGTAWLQREAGGRMTRPARSADHPFRAASSCDDRRSWKSGCQQPQVRPAGRRPGSAPRPGSPVLRTTPDALLPARSSAGRSETPRPWTRPPAAGVGCILLRQPPLAR